MSAPFSMDLRKRLFDGVEAGASCHAVAEQFVVSVSAVIKLMQRHRDHGTIEACKFGGGRRPDLEPHYDLIRALVADKPEITIEELRLRLAEAGVHTSRSPLGRCLLRLNLTRKKKTRHAAEQTRADVAAARIAWRAGQPDLRARRLIFLDETWASTNMVRLYGRAPRGERLIAAVPHGHWKTTTFIAAVCLDGIVAPYVLDGPIDGETFRAYIEQMLAPTLKPGDLVIMDNLASHKVRGVREAVIGLSPNPKLHKTVDSDGFVSPEGTMLDLNYEGIIPLLTKAVQDLKSDNGNLRAANENQQAEIKALTVRLDAIEARRQ